MKREGLRSQSKRTMKNNEYTKLDKHDSLNDEYDRISLKDLADDATSSNKSNQDDSKLIALSSSDDEKDAGSGSDEHVVGYKQNLKKDFKNICLLMFLYFLQGRLGI